MLPADQIITIIDRLEQNNGLKPLIKNKVTKDYKLTLAYMYLIDSVKTQGFAVSKLSEALREAVERHEITEEERVEIMDMIYRQRSYR